MAMNVRQCGKRAIPVLQRYCRSLLQDTSLVDKSRQSRCIQSSSNLTKTTCINRQSMIRQFSYSAIVQETNTSLVTKRKMAFEDTQMYGIVHGGVLMELTEEVGARLTTEYCNSPEAKALNGSDQRATTVFAAVESMNFLQPIFMEEEADVISKIVYTSPHSLRVKTEVFAGSSEDGTQRKITECICWYVPINNENNDTVLAVPALDYTPPDDVTAGQESYKKLKKFRENGGFPYSRIPIVGRKEDFEPFTPIYSQKTTFRPIQPSTCRLGESYGRGGLLMQWMDDVGAFAGITHSNYYCQTINVRNLIYYNKFRLGTAVNISGKALFSSSKTIEYQVSAEEEFLHHGKGISKRKVADGIFTFVIVDENGSARNVPPLIPQTEEEKRIFKERKALYDERNKTKNNKKC